MARGDHLVICMTVYTHHGIDVGDGTVVHWATPDGTKQVFDGTLTKDLAAIRRTSFDQFAEGRPVEVRSYADGFSAETVVARALGRVGEHGYDLLDNNCEHFVTWCKTGRHDSEQVKNGMTLLVGVACLGTGLAGSAGILSATRLAVMGRFLGVGPVPLLVGILSVPAAVSLVAAWSLFPVDVAESPAEQDARTLARVASLAGAAAGTAAALGAVAAAGPTGLGVLGLAALFTLPAAATLGAAGLAYVQMSSWLRLAEETMLLNPTNRSEVGDC
jgi:hypothetical protein